MRKNKLEMIRMIAFSLLFMAAFHIYYLMKKRLQKILRGGEIEEAESSAKKRGTLVKNTYTGEYYVR
ncbi:hypothetical protein GCM10023262_05380 [Bartonella pachyuromydis]|uniref:Uncharacterized protein n=1 Tax=Bartonella pachyuromydis TaxID=931097 RepID=A0ABP8VFJ7_9HYPH